MANRETRRREKIKKEAVVMEGELSTASNIKIAVAVVVIFIIFYILTTAITNNMKNDGDKIIEPVVIQYEEILAGELFNMNRDQYFVLFYDFEDGAAPLYASLAASYKQENGIQVYKVDLGKGFNEVYISEEGNHNVNKIEDLKINGPTLIKIKNKKNILYIEGKDSIKEVLK
ncbi:MAG TPA: hypothetical protein GX725_02405 [Mollicutes bacterium]|nr:hypothetical protein [Mollicutes bacterium]